MIILDYVLFKMVLIEKEYNILMGFWI